MVLLTAAGKTTFLESLRKFYPEAILVSEPINKWQSILVEKEVIKEKHNTRIHRDTHPHAHRHTQAHTCIFYTGWYHYNSPLAGQQLP